MRGLKFERGEHTFTSTLGRLGKKNIFDYLILILEQFFQFIFNTEHLKDDM